jgi:hypothetical protein
MVRILRYRPVAPGPVEFGARLDIDTFAEHAVEDVVDAHLDQPGV